MRGRWSVAAGAVAASLVVAAAAPAALAPAALAPQIDWSVRAGIQSRPPVTPGPPASREELLHRAGATAEAYLVELPRLVATESMSQQVLESRFKVLDRALREWKADVAWVRLRDAHDAIAIRDVLEVDGVPVTEGRSRLIELLHGSRRGTWSEARALLDQGARHNLVPGSRNFNLPTVTLFFLHPETRPRFRWSSRWPRDAHASSAGPFEIAFRERSRPTVIRGTGGEQIYSRGRVWVMSDGSVNRTELQLELGPMKYSLNTEFGFDAAVSLVVPYRLTERYASPNGVVVSTARYSNYRRFEAGARLLP
jgi:hypothetical protein